MGANGLSLAPDKSEAVLLVETRTIREMRKGTIETWKRVRYLEEEFQRNVRVAKQVERVISKAKMVVNPWADCYPMKEDPGRVKGE